MAEEISFPFPFSPYDVQEQFMQSLYNVLDASQFGIFESPTGTGKSLSIICGALKWLKDFQKSKKADLQHTVNQEVANDSDHNWFNDFLSKQVKQNAIADAKKELEFLVSHESFIKKLKTCKSFKKSESKFNVMNLKKARCDDSSLDIQDDDFTLKQDDDDVNEDEKEEEKPNILKIFYASRTHSQLSQFLGEIKRSPYKDEITVTTLGSRSNLCVNETVSKLKNISLINEKCIEMQRNKSKGQKCCPCIKNLSDIEENILSSVTDIEDVVAIGKELKSCPYYASRNVIPKAEIVVLPYNILLHKPTRDAYKIVLKDNIVIIDEAHNLVEALNSMYSAEISGECLEQSFWQLDAYYKSYQGRFSPQSIKYLSLFLSVLKSLIVFLKTSKNAETTSKMTSIVEFFSLTGIANVNFFELARFCEKSLIGQKLHGFTSAKVTKGMTLSDDLKRQSVPKAKNSTFSFLSQIKQMQSSKSNEKPLDTLSADHTQYRPSAFFTFIEFIKTLTFPTEDGRILFCKAPSMQKSFLKFLHLNSSTHFQDIVSTARSVVLAGGTMQPVSEFIDLFTLAGVSADRIAFFGCGHVIPPENLLTLGLETGPCGNKLDFTFKSRKLPGTVRELGSILLNICNYIRGGVVCFFPSYDYEDFVFNELTKNKVLDAIQKKKKLFREPKLSSDVDKVLSDYAKTVSLAKNQPSQGCNGAILFSIVGGKMSEGINFSDELGRCVVMIGLPYPNKYSIELKEKMAYLTSKADPADKNAGDVYYNNLCMKAVNQSIGRAIRHKNDFAAIILLDYRYKTPVVKNALPGWILKSFVSCEKFGPAVVALRKFFSAKVMQ